jgi:hypothetical protein
LLNISRIVGSSGGGRVSGGVHDAQPADLLKAARRVTVQHMAHIARDYEGVDGAARYPHALAGFGGQLSAETVNSIVPSIM